MLNDHLSILDSNNDAALNKSNFDNEGAEGDDGESGYISKESLPKSKIRIKVWKSSVEPSSNNKKKNRSAAPWKQTNNVSAEEDENRVGSPLNYVRDKKR